LTKSGRYTQNPRQGHDERNLRYFVNYKRDCEELRAVGL
jgi:hypothetical protein